MQTSKLYELSKYALLPLAATFLVGVDYFTKDTWIDTGVPYFESFVSFLIILTLERLYRYRHAVSQKHMIWRDMTSTMVQAFMVGSVFALVLYPVLHYLPETFLGRRLLFGLSNQLGPLWLQIPIVMILQSLWHYWMHRFEHTNEFLWKLHGYHHSVTHLQVSNVLVSNPFEWGLRNTMGPLLIAIIGFNPVAIVFAGAMIKVGGGFGGHCGADVEGGWLNYIWMTPQVHRWHHTTEFPDDPKWRYGCNFGVEFSFWDILFGTYLFPKDENGKVLAPPAIGHPSGYPDEPNYLKILLMARAFPTMDRFVDRICAPFNKKTEGNRVLPVAAE